MSKARLSVRQLAKESELPVDDVITKLGGCGISVSTERSSIERPFWRRARSALGVVGTRDSNARQNHEPAADAVRAQDQIAAPPTETGFQWKTVGTVEELSLLTAEQVNKIHWALVRDFTGSDDPVDPPGLRDTALFHSAVDRPKTSFGGQLKYPTVSLGGSALFHALVHNHPFHNGNKRTALVSLVVFLDQHGYVLKTSQEDLYDYVLEVADHKIIDVSMRDAYYSDREMIEIARWLQREMRHVDRSEYPLQFRRLKAILAKHGCEFDVLQGNKLNIRRESNQTQIAYGGDGREADASTVHKVRRDLGLDDSQGYDSAVFYRDEDPIPEFITRYRDLLTRLAKV